MSYQHQQPAGTLPMSLTGGAAARLNAKNMPLDKSGYRDWSNGLCGCTSACGTCCLAFFCPCIVYGKNKIRYDHLAHQGYPDPEQGGSCCNSGCWLHCLVNSFFGVGFIPQFIHRGHMRGRYRINGSGCGDCCTAFWCASCELTQERIELELEEQTFRAPGARH